MGYDMQEGTVVRWRKREGEEVTRGEVIAEIETDKATVEMEAYSTGVLGMIVVAEGTTVPVGQLIAVITDPGEALPALDQLAVELPAEAGAADAPATPAVAAPSAPPGEVPSTAPSPGQVRASPIARRLAREKGIDLALVAGTGPGGRITEADMQAYEEGTVAAPGAAPAVAPDGIIELTRMRRAIAGVTVQSKRETPHFYVTSEIDMTRAMDLRRQLNETLQASAEGTERGAPRVSVNDMIVKAAARALEKHPKFNASFQGDHLQLHGDLNIGIAIALEQGLIVPAIGGCQSKSLVEMAVASTDLIRRAQGGALRAEEYTGGTFSISNLGMFDVDSFAAIISPPNAAVLAVGTVKEQPVARDGQVTIAQIMKATLSADHRVADGAEGAQFLMEVKRNLETPAGLLI